MCAFHEFRAIAFLLIALLIRRGSPLQCYVCGWTEEKICESSLDADERFLKTCNESATHCYTGKITIHHRFRSPVNHVVLGCRTGERNGCEVVGETLSLTYGEVCHSTCETDGCNKKDVPPISTTAATTATTFDEESTLKYTHAMTYPHTTWTNSGSRCGGTLCGQWDRYCCSNEEYRYCCSFEEYQQNQIRATTTEDKIESTPTYSSSLQRYWWAIVFPITTIVSVIFLVIWRRKLRKRDASANSSSRLSRRQHRVTSGGRLSQARSTELPGFFDQPQEQFTPAAAPTNSSRTDVPLNFERNLQETLQRLDDGWISMWNEPTTVEQDDPPTYYSVDFRRNGQRPLHHHPSLSNGHDVPPPYSPAPISDEPNILPSYSSVVSGNCE